MPVATSTSTSPAPVPAKEQALPLHIRIISSLVQLYHESLGRKAVESSTKGVTVEASVDFSKIRYSQVWEDTRLLRQGLRLKPQSRVLSIASAGDNAFSLLLDDAREVVAIGMYCQMFLCVASNFAISTNKYDILIMAIE